MKRKILSIFLCLLMVVAVFAVVPMNIGAEEEPPEEPMVIEIPEPSETLGESSGEESTEGDSLSRYWVRFTEDEYGTPEDPKWEGDEILFTVVHSQELIYFRYDLDADDDWDIPEQVDEDPFNLDNWVNDDSVSWLYSDDFNGEALVEAWDGFSTRTEICEGDIWDGDTSYSWLMGGYLYCTVGLQFQVHQDITITELGVYRYGAYAYTYYNLRLWKVDGHQLLYSVDYPFIPYYTWTWFPITPTFCPVGEYIVSVGIYYYYQIGDDNPGMTPDGIIEPLGWCRAYGQYSYPSQFYGSNPCPYVDIHYSYDNGVVPDTADDTANAWIQNVDPVVAITGPASGSVFAMGTPVSFTGTFTDAGSEDTHTAEWKFDSITLPGTVSEVDGSGSVSDTYSFTTAGVYSITLTVTDDDDGVGTASTVGELTALVVIYDPEGGFVTGGGWIYSPEGAYHPNPILTGKASFGFVAKYKKGQSTPSGNTEFQFKAGDLNFHSDSYEWLVIAGAKAQFKGTGTINNVGEYKFMLWATDGALSGGGGGADLFRIKIWEEDEFGVETVIYDNKEETELGGGQIMIHKG